MVFVRERPLLAQDLAKCLVLGEHPGIHRRNQLGVGAYKSSYVLSRWTLTPIRGAAELIPTRPTTLESDQELAQGAHKVGATVTATFGGLVPQELGPDNPLPKRPLWVTRLSFPKAVRLTEDDFLLLERAKHLETVEIGGMVFSDADFESLTRLSQVRGVPRHELLTEILDPAGKAVRVFEAEKDLVHNPGHGEPLDDAWGVIPLVHKADFVGYGPYRLNLRTDCFHTVTYRVKVDSITEAGRLVELDVFDYDNKQVITRRPLYAKDSQSLGQYQDFTLPFYYPLAHRMEYRVRWDGRCKVWLDRVTLRSPKHVCDQWDVRCYQWGRVRLIRRQRPSGRWLRRSR